MAVTDYMKALPNSIARWMPRTFTALGTDGFGLSESRADLRDHFEVSERYIAAAALTSLHRQGALAADRLRELLAQLEVDADKLDPMSR